MYATIIPSELGLLNKTAPEKWFFVLTGDAVVTQAMQLGLDHDMYPVAVLATDYDGYSSTPVSKLETISGLQETMDWMFTSHIANVRKAINDMIVVDPYLVNIKDLRDPEPGKLIRLRKAAWGRGIENAVKQLNVTDVTRGHIQDLSIIASLMENVSGANDVIKGVRRAGGERVSATESRDTFKSALSRLQKGARIGGLQAYHDLAYMLASHTQQLMDNDTYVRTIGRWQEVLEDEYGNEGVRVTPFDILLDYDISLRNGSIPSTEDAGVWERVFQTVVMRPELLGVFDVVRIFKHVARLSGATDVQQFVKKGGSIQASTISNQALQGLTQSGGAVALPGARGGEASGA
jgi:hypothetical protein